MEAIQADVTLLDAEVFTPFILAAFANASQPGAPAALAALAADARVAEAIGRLRPGTTRRRRASTTGYDAADVDGERLPPSAAEVQRSIAATIYSVWRGQAIRNGVDTTLNGLGVPTPGSAEAIKALRHLVERDGIGLSTVDFFGWAAPLGLPQAEQRRDYVLLKSLQDALDRLAGPSFPGRVQWLDQPGRLRLGQAAPDRVRRARGGRARSVFRIRSWASRRRSTTCPGSRPTAASASSMPRRTARGQRLERVHVRLGSEPPLRRRAGHRAGLDRGPDRRCPAA